MHPHAIPCRKEAFCYAVPLLKCPACVVSVIDLAVAAEQNFFTDVRQILLLEAGASLNLAKGTALRLLENLRSRAVQAAQALYAEIEAENANIASARPELSATMAGESRCLRAILHTVLKEMTKQIA